MKNPYEIIKKWIIALIMRLPFLRSILKPQKIDINHSGLFCFFECKDGVMVQGLCLYENKFLMTDGSIITGKFLEVLKITNINASMMSDKQIEVGSRILNLREEFEFEKARINLK